jgi:hypothetical protein
MADTYRCAMCWRVFEKGRSDEEAIAEMEKRDALITPPNIPPYELEVVCDDCFKLMVEAEKRTLSD